jgi:hypothetical protein
MANYELSTRVLDCPKCRTPLVMLPCPFCGRAANWDSRATLRIPKANESRSSQSSTTTGSTSALSAWEPRQCPERIHRQMREPVPAYMNRLQCVECGRVSPENERGWRGRLTVDDEIVVYWGTSSGACCGCAFR